MKQSAILLIALITLALQGVGCDSGDDRTPPIGPDLQGNWSGRYFVSRAADPMEEAITASVSHNGDAIVITTSKIGVGATLTGTIDEDGDMTLTDPSDGETWTTFFGPATSTSFRVADFLFDDELQGASPLQVIELSR